MQLRKLSISWQGGGAANVVIKTMLQGEVIFTAETGRIESESQPFNGEFLEYWESESVEIDRAEIKVVDVQRAGSYLTLTGDEGTMDIKLDIGTHTYHVLPDAGIYEEVSSGLAISPWVIAVGAGVGALIILKDKFMLKSSHSRR